LGVCLKGGGGNYLVRFPRDLQDDTEKKKGANLVPRKQKGGTSGTRNVSPKKKQVARRRVASTLEGEKN